MYSNKIERAAVRALEAYIDKRPYLEPIILKNDKTPFWDGEIYVYEEDHHTVDNFYARVPLQVKGTTIAKDKSYRIDRDYLVGYKADRGCIFFLVQINNKTPKILYSLLSSDALDILLKQNTKTIKIDLCELPEDPLAFDRDVFNFATKRQIERNESTTTKDIEAL